MSFLKLAFATLVFSTVATPIFAQAACPNLSGTYSCSAMGRNFNMLISQSGNSFTIGGGTFIVDGGQHALNPLPSVMAPYLRNVTYQASCNGSGLSFSGNGQGASSGRPVTLQGSVSRSGNGVALYLSAGGKVVQGQCQSLGGMNPSDDQAGNQPGDQGGQDQEQGDDQRPEPQQPAPTKTCPKWWPFCRK